MPTDAYEPDSQDQAEVFDEDNFDPEEAGGPGAEFRTFEEIPDVYDVTTRVGDARDSQALDGADFDPEAIDDEDLEDEDEVVDDDVYDETDQEDLADPDAEDRVSAGPAQDTPLVYEADVQGLQGAQGSAAHFESRGELDQNQVDALGYGKPKETKHER